MFTSALIAFSKAIVKDSSNKRARAKCSALALLASPLGMKMKKNRLFYEKENAVWSFPIYFLCSRKSGQQRLVAWLKSIEKWKVGRARSQGHWNVFFFLAFSSCTLHAPIISLPPIQLSVPFYYSTQKISKTKNKLKTVWSRDGGEEIFFFFDFCVNKRTVFWGEHLKHHAMLPEKDIFLWEMWAEFVFVGEVTGWKIQDALFSFSLAKFSSSSLKSKVVNWKKVYEINMRFIIVLLLTAVCLVKLSEGLLFRINFDFDYVSWFK